MKTNPKSNPKSNPHKKNVKNLSEPLKNAATYAVTLPERLLFSLTSVVSGVFDASSELLLPQWMRNSTSYRVTLGLMHRFINQNIVGLQSDENLSNDQYLQRKTAGTILEAAGFAVFRFSPVWFFAIISDAAGGSSIYLDHLTKSLKANGLISQEQNPTQIKDLLAAVQKSSDATASIMDMPPISVSDAGKMAQSIYNSYAMTGEKAGELLPDVEDVWKSIQSLSSKGFSMDSIIGMMTLDAAKSATAQAGQFGALTARSTIEATAEIVDHHIIKSYRETLKQLDEEGPAHYMERKMKPYLSASLGHFSTKRVTWTEKGMKKAVDLHDWIQSKKRTKSSEKNSKGRKL